MSEVTPNGPSDKAGLKGGTGQTSINGVPYPIGGDIVLRINDQPVHTSADIIDYLASDTEVGQTVTLTVLRNGVQKQIKVVLAARPSGK